MSSSQPLAPVGGSQTVVQQILPREETLVLRLSTPAAVPEPDDRPHVTWAADVIDNEHLGRLKSNCCCIYTKPRRWDDPSTWEQDEHETEHCRGHTLPDPVDNNKESNEEKVKHLKGTNLAPRAMELVAVNGFT